MVFQFFFVNIVKIKNKKKYMSFDCLNLKALYLSIKEILYDTVMFYIACMNMKNNLNYKMNEKHYKTNTCAIF